MNAIARRATFGLAAIYALRMLGLFMVMPVFTLYAGDLVGYTAALAGVAIGIYGLTQAALQIPFGLLSDHIGRKPVIFGGLALFAVGSVVAALAETMTGMIIGRALQGSGAVAAAVMAMAADLTPEEHRTKAMAVIGMSIGAAFFLSLILGPVAGSQFGLAGIFWLTAALSLAGIGILAWVVPTPTVSRVHRDAEPVPAQFGRILGDGQLLRLDAGILILHAAMTATFLALPLALRDHVGIAPEHHWAVYTGVLVASVALMVPFVVIAERNRRIKPVFAGAVAALAVALTGLAAAHGTLWTLLPLLVLYFTAFNILEATLPSLVSKIAPAESKGTAMGVYSTSQFFGAFLGGVVGGWMLHHYGIAGAFATGAAGAVLWFALAATMRPPAFLTSRLVNVGPLGKAEAGSLAARLAAIPGVAEAVVVAEEGVAYLKIDRRALDEEALAQATGPG